MSLAGLSCGPERLRSAGSPSLIHKIFFCILGHTMATMTTARLHAPKILFASDHSLLVSFGYDMSLENHARVRQLTKRLLSSPDPAILNLHPAYASVLITFDPLKSSPQSLREYLSAELDQLLPFDDPPARSIEIPVCYKQEFGPDLEAVAAHTGLTVDEVVRVHSSATYRVYFLGFAPGFPYLGGMPSQISTPRLSSPRKQVPAGSVAIGGNQTGIYPGPSPGGWRIIGRSPLKFFDVDANPPSYLLMGDLVTFKPITSTQFEQMLFSSSH